MPVPVQTTKHVTPLRKAFGLFGGLRLKLDETVVPVAVVEQLSPDDWSNAFVGDTQAASGAGNVHIWALENPAASGCLIELFEVIVASTNGSIWAITIADPPYVPGNIIAGQWQDLAGVYGTGGGIFYLPGRNPSGQMRHAAAAVAVAGAIVAHFNVPAQHDVYYHPKVILHPGQQINVYTQTQNIEGRCSFQWRERPLQPSER